jgi:hypothetical protein
LTQAKIGIWSIGGGVLLWTIVYLGCWLLAYLMINDDLGPKLITEYFVLAWTFNAGERPFFTQVFSLLLFGIVVAGVVFTKRRKRKHRELIEQILRSR